MNLVIAAGKNGTNLYRVPENKYCSVGDALIAIWAREEIVIYCVSGNFHLEEKEKIALVKKAFEVDPSDEIQPVIGEAYVQRFDTAEFERREKP